MRAFALLIAFLSATIASGAPPQHPEPSYRFDKGLWFDGQRFIKRTVYASERRLQFTPPAKVDSVVDLAGAFVMLAAQKGITVVTTAVLIERRKEKEPELHASLRRAQIDNLRLLRDAGVTLAIGSDEYDDTSVGEVRHLRGLGVFEDLELLRMWTQNCARTVFPERKVGRVDAGYEPSFVALDSNPLTDWSSLGRIRYRFKDGLPLVLADRSPEPSAGRRRKRSSVIAETRGVPLARRHTDAD